MADTNVATRFTSDNQPAKRRGKTPKTLLLEALKNEAGIDEAAFYELIVRRAITGEDPMLTREILARLQPIHKATLPDVQFEIPRGTAPVDKVVAIIDAVADGKCPPDVGDMMIGMIKNMLDIYNVTELAEKVRRIEERLGELGQ
ncbi:hypothetical protein PCO31110_01610 [Pandoraea communis]|uniref:Uncharacterized protein n=1 Tax=Pandoraea communis TaxID=2508297 RepID=A0A5E4TUB1_9BURK|nr:hypothetical protein [Pandoraea communis]VVD90822.1 hypothetical protein PCO31110_01610 [Pandoraea communis]